MTAPAPNRNALAFIFVTVALDILALGIIIPVLPRLVLQFLGGDTARAAVIYGVFGTVWALMQFVFSPVVGVLSDRFGRRPVILLSNFGLGLDYVVMALAPTLWWLLVGRIVSGISASSISTAYAYIADVTPPERRAAAFGLIGVAFGLGFVLGPAVGGLLGGLDPRLPFWVAAGLSLANFLYGLFVLPESLPPGRRSASFSWARANPVGALTMLRSHGELSALAAVMFLSYLAHEVLPSTTVLYMTYRYGWNEASIGLMMAAVGVCSAVVQGLLIRHAAQRFPLRRVAMTGLLFGAVGFAIYASADNGALFMAGVPVVALWGLAGPAIQALMTERVGPDEQGQLQGANSSLRGISGLIGPTIFTQAFAQFIGASGLHLPGAPFYLAAALLAGAALLTVQATHKVAAKNA
ncbi:MAG TPA: TCR/Tet family MFS transporter [Candidatus Cybelea sp.]|nr:TCR/Tet family MFS transporter [Candidatus Cybelea sp.]